MAAEVNQAVEQAHRRGILTAASLMVGGHAAGEAVALARRLPRLRVGLHVVLVDGRPIAPVEQVPDLVDSEGRFHTNMVQAGIGFFLRPSLRRQLAIEIEAQFRAFVETGLALDHVNAHKHFHLHPTIAGLIMRIGQRYGLKAMRVPLEPAAVIGALEPQSDSASLIALASWAKLLRRLAHRQGILTPDCVFGLAWSGAMTVTRLKALMRHLSAGITEIYLHPATANAFPGAAAGYRYTEELAALTASEVKRAAQVSGARFCGFAEVGQA